MMNEPAPKKRPFLVRITLFGITERLAAVICFWFCVGMAGLTVYLHLKWWWGVGLCLTAFGYWLAIWWMDKNSGWRK